MPDRDELKSRRAWLFPAWIAAGFVPAMFMIAMFIFENQDMENQAIVYVYPTILILLALTPFYLVFWCGRYPNKDDMSDLKTYGLVTLMTMLNGLVAFTGCSAL